MAFVSPSDTREIDPKLFPDPKKLTEGLFRTLETRSCLLCKKLVSAASRVAVSTPAGEKWYHPEHLPRSPSAP